MNVTDLVGSKYESWEQRDCVLIATPTGSGKTTFIRDTICKYAEGALQKSKVIYLCNRSTLSSQIRELQMSALGAPEETEERSSRTSSENKVVGNLLITTYQHCEQCNEFPAFSTSAASDQFWNDANIKYIVFDEAHYFVADALFNPNTNYWYEKLMRNAPMRNSFCTYIFLTATPEPFICFWSSLCKDYFLTTRGLSNRVFSISTDDIVKETAAERAKESAKRSAPVRKKDFPHKVVTYKKATEPICMALEYFNSNNHTNDLMLNYFSEPPSYDNVNVMYFKGYDELLPILPHGATQDRWLIFVSDKDTGQQLDKGLSTRCSSAFITRETKRQGKGPAYEQRQHIIESGTFTCDVLITTSVLDCGINITDPSVKNIVIDTSDKTSFLQMLGRRRLKSGDHINLYIRSYSIAQINLARNRLLTKMRYIEDFYRLEHPTVKIGKPNGKTMKSFRASYFSDNDVASIWNRTIRNITAPSNYGLTYADICTFNPDGTLRADLSGTSFHYSKTAVLSIMYTLKSYNDILSIFYDTQDDATFLRVVLSWLGKKYDESRWITYKEKGVPALKVLLQKYNLEGRLFPDKSIAFQSEFIELILNMPIPPKSIRKDLSRYRQKEGLPRKLPGKRVINEALTDLLLPYQVISKQSSGCNRKSYWLVISSDS